MKRALLLLLTLAFLAPSIAQEKKKKLKKPNLKIGERIGDMAGNLMTSKTAILSETSPVVNLIPGVYDPDTKTSESKYFPEGTEEGDHLMYISFFKNDGVGLCKIEGEVECEGQPLQYVGLGSYGMRFDKPVEAGKVITVKTETGDEASFEVDPIADIEILEVNGDPTLPIIDLNEDLRIKFSHPEGAEGTNVKVGLLTNITGVRAWNYFADFKATDKEVLIPKESFSNLEISGAMGAGQVNKGYTYLVVTRERVVEASQAREGQITGSCAKPKLQTISYGSKPVIVKGKQENGVIAQLKFSGRHRGHYAYSIYKPNARTGIPFSRGSSFGLASLSINGRTYKQESKSGSNSWTVGNTKYTQTWTRTTTYEFPQLGDEYWENAMDRFYTEFTKLFNEKFEIGFVPVDKVTGSAAYAETFAVNETNTRSKISKTYKDTRRVSPTRFVDIWNSLSSSQSGDTKTVLMMQESGTDGLVSLEINFDIGADKKDKIVLLPSVLFSIQGMDETKENREGTYAEGRINLSQGIPFSEEALKNDPDYLVKVLNMPELLATLSYMLENLRMKEVEMGYDKIWSIGE